MNNNLTAFAIAILFTICLTFKTGNAQSPPVPGEVPTPVPINCSPPLSDPNLSLAQKLEGWTRTLSHDVALHLTPSDIVLLSHITCEFRANNKKGLENIKIVNSSNPKQIDARILKILKQQEIARYKPDAIGRLFRMDFSKNKDGRPVVETKLVR